MDLRDRITRRQTAERNGIVDSPQLSPVVHPDKPVGRGPVLKQLLDALDPVFERELPPEVAVVGPHGSGKSAVVTALFDALDEQFGRSCRPIGTATRAGSGESVTCFVSIDARRVTSPFAFYQAVLSEISSEAVPEKGVGTDALRERVRSRLERPNRRAVVAIDHHDEPETLSYDTARELLEPVSKSVTTVSIGQTVPEGIEGKTVIIPKYRHHELIDIITERASAALAAGTIDYETIHNVGTWADGNAHDALAVLFGAAMFAANTGRIDNEVLDRSMAAIPESNIHVGRALALLETRCEVLCRLYEIGPEATTLSISRIATEISSQSSLTDGTVERFLYELSERDILDRVPLPMNGTGRQQSTVRPLFPMVTFVAHYKL